MAEVFKYAEGATGRRKHQKVEAVVALHVDTRAAVRSTADDVARTADAVLAGHRHDGHSEILRLDGDIDSYVVLSDERGMGAAMTIEYGRQDHLNEDGELVGGSAGVAPLRAAAGLAKFKRKGKR